MSTTSSKREMADSELGRALQFHRANNFGEAEKIYRKVLEIDTRNIQANHLLGVVLYQTRRLNEALDCYKKVIDLKPDFVDVYCNAGIVLKDLGRMDEAIASFEKALKLNPDIAFAHNNLGNVFRDGGRLSDAIRSYRRAIEINPEFAECHSNLGNALRDQGHFEEAIECFRKAINLKPDLAGVYNNLGNAYRGARRLAEAETAYRRALEIQPSFLDALNNLGIALAEMGKLDEALLYHKQALSLDAESIETHRCLARVFTDLNRIDEAIDAYHKILRLVPDSAEVLNSIGLGFKDLGRVDEAIMCFEKALTVNSNHINAMANLALLRKYSKVNDEVLSIEKVYEELAPMDDKRVPLAYVLARVYENLEQYEQAFDYLAVAQGIQAESSSFDIDITARRFQSIQKEINSEFLKRSSDWGVFDEGPLFVLGMPRSGTSLVEQILASHPEVCGAGELKLMGELAQEIERRMVVPYPFWVEEVQRELINELGARYIKALRKYSLESRFVTDKMPTNFLYIGLILTALPRARIIHCRRDPMDTCFSIFKSQFVEPHPYSHRLEDLGAYYLLYEDLMNHWHNCAPGRILDVKYEHLVFDSEQQIRRILAHCDLDFHEDCLSFYKTNRVVKTASALQVRQPIYQNSVEFWMHYEKQLAPLKQIIFGASSRE